MVKLNEILNTLPYCSHFANVKMALLRSIKQISVNILEQMTLHKTILHKINPKSNFGFSYLHFYFLLVTILNTLREKC